MKYLRGSNFGAKMNIQFGTTPFIFKYLRGSNFEAKMTIQFGATPFIFKYLRGSNFGAKMNIPLPLFKYLRGSNFGAKLNIQFGTAHSGWIWLWFKGVNVGPFFLLAELSWDFDGLRMPP